MRKQYNSVKKSDYWYCQNFNTFWLENESCLWPKTRCQRRKNESYLIQEPSRGDFFSTFFIPDRPGSSPSVHAPMSTHTLHNLHEDVGDVTHNSSLHCPCHSHCQTFLGISALVSFLPEVENPCLLCSKFQGVKNIFVESNPKYFCVHQPKYFWLTTHVVVLQAWASVLAGVEQTTTTNPIYSVEAAPGTVTSLRTPLTRLVVESLKMILSIHIQRSLAEHLKCLSVLVLELLS